jgi:hypothetical protein
MSRHCPTGSELPVGQYLSMTKGGTEYLYWPMKEHSSLTLEWPVAGADPTPERPIDDPCERRFVAESRGSQCSPKPTVGYAAHFGEGQQHVKNARVRWIAQSSYRITNLEFSEMTTLHR